MKKIIIYLKQLWTTDSERALFSAIQEIQKKDEQHLVLRCFFRWQQSLRKKFNSELKTQIDRGYENYSRDITISYSVMLEISVLPISIIIEFCGWIIKKYESIKLSGIFLDEDLILQKFKNSDPNCIIKYTTVNYYSLI